MKKSNKILIITLAIILTIIFSLILIIGIVSGVKSVGDKVFGNFIEERQAINEEHKKDLEQGEKNAINYISQKYNFTPTIISSENVYTHSGFLAGYTEYVTVKLKYNNKTFYVYIDGGNENIDGRDNYQYDEIVNDVLDLLYKDLQDIPYAYKIKYAIYDNNIGMINTFYNGNNLDEILEKQKTSTNKLNIELLYINSSKIKDLSYLSPSKILNDSTIKIMNFKSIEDYNLSDKPSGIIYNAPYLNDGILYSNGEINRINLNLFEKDGIYVYCENNNNYNNISLQKIRLDDISKWKEFESDDVKKSSEAYSLSGFNKDDTVYVYIPLSMLEGFSHTDTYINTDIRIKYNNSTYSTASSKVIGNYLVFYFEIKDSNNPNFEFVALRSE